MAGNLDKSNSDDDRTTEFVRLLNRHERQLAAYVLGLVPNWADADEIVQETRVRLWQQFDEYQPDKSFVAWACTVAHYLVLAYRKRVGRERARFSDAFAQSLAQQCASMPDEPGLLQEALSHCLEQLTSRARDLLRSYYSRESAVEQIAEDQGRSSSAIYKSLTAARLFLYECINLSLSKEHGREQR